MNQAKGVRDDDPTNVAKWFEKMNILYFIDLLCI